MHEAGTAVSEIIGRHLLRQSESAMQDGRKRWNAGSIGILCHCTQALNPPDVESLVNQVPHSLDSQIRRLLLLAFPRE